MQRLIAVAFLAVNIPAIAGENLCGTDEITYFSCRSKQKLVSLCGSARIDETKGYIQYRFGSKAAVELAFPAKGRHPLGVFSKGFIIWSHGGYEATVNFSRGQYRYAIYSNLQLGSVEAMNNATTDLYGPHAGVRVYRGDKVVAEVRCTNDDFTDPRDLHGRLPGFLSVATD